MRTLNSFETWRRRAMALRCQWLELIHGHRIDRSARLSFAAKLVSGGRASISVGACTVVALRALIISRTAEGGSGPVRIGRNSFIGAGAVVLPGVTIGDGSIVAAGSIVFEDVASGTIVGGNPAKLIQRGVDVAPFGRLPDSWDNSERYWRPGDPPRRSSRLAVWTVAGLIGTLSVIGIIYAQS